MLMLGSSIPCSRPTRDVDTAGIRCRLFVPLVLAFLFVASLVAAPLAARAAYLSTQIVTDPFVGASSGPLLVYTPFDGAQGLLTKAEVTITGVVDFSAIITMGDPGTVLPYDFLIEQKLEASSPELGFAWVGGGFDAKLQFQGAALVLQPFPVSRIVTYTFSVDRNSDIGGVVPVSASGVDVVPAGVATRLEHFIDTRCNDARSYESAISMNFVPLSPPLLAAAAPYSYTGSMQIAYTFITTDQLQDHVANGDFEGPSLSPWSSSGAGAGRLSSPPQCLAGTLNQLLELEAGSPIEVSQTISTPADPFTLTFDYGFAQNSGTLEIWFQNTLVDQIDAAGLAMLFRSRVLSVSDPAILGQAAIPLRIVWNAASGDRAWIDNVKVLSVPEPNTSLLAIAALATVVAVRRFRSRMASRRRGPARRGLLS